MFDLCLVPHDEIADSLPPEWNSLERYDPGTTKLLNQGDAALLRSLELKARAAHGEALMAQARASKLEDEVRRLELHIERMRRSPNWRIGRLAIAPARLARRTLRRVVA